MTSRPRSRTPVAYEESARSERGGGAGRACIGGRAERGPPMRPVVTTAEMRALDRATIEDVGLPALTLMETAGRAVAVAAREMIDLDDHVAVVCGPGNNGGDGFVAARVLRAMGVDATVYLAVPVARIKGDAAAHLAILEQI